MQTKTTISQIITQIQSLIQSITYTELAINQLFVPDPRVTRPMTERYQSIKHGRMPKLVWNQELCETDHWKRTLVVNKLAFWKYLVRLTYFIFNLYLQFIYTVYQILLPDLLTHDEIIRTCPDRQHTWTDRTVRASNSVCLQVSNTHPSKTTRASRHMCSFDIMQQCASLYQQHIHSSEVIRSDSHNGKC